jgi:hypothetical protein
MTRIRVGPVPGLLLVLALAVAACGGGGGGGKSNGVASLGGSATSTTSGSNAGGGNDISNDFRQALAFARCMRQHGINLPDPQVTAEGVLLDEQLPTGMRKDDPRLKAAEQVCRQRGRGGR